jgi:hypothetical protein
LVHDQVANKQVFDLSILKDLSSTSTWTVFLCGFPVAQTSFAKAMFSLASNHGIFQDIAANIAEEGVSFSELIYKDLGAESHSWTVCCWLPHAVSFLASGKDSGVVPLLI